MRGPLAAGGRPPPDGPTSDPLNGLSRCSPSFCGRTGRSISGSLGGRTGRSNRPGRSRVPPRRRSASSNRRTARSLSTSRCGRGRSTAGGGTGGGRSPVPVWPVGGATASRLRRGAGRARSDSCTGGTGRCRWAPASPAGGATAGGAMPPPDRQPPARSGSRYRRASSNRLGRPGLSEAASFSRLRATPGPSRSGLWPPGDTTWRGTRARSNPGDRIPAAASGCDGSRDGRLPTVRLSATSAGGRTPRARLPRPSGTRLLCSGPTGSAPWIGLRSRCSMRARRAHSTRPLPNRP